MELKDALINVRAREKSGSTTSHRYDYQKNWALCQILEKHRSGEDYVFVFEHHEDILLLDSEVNPQQVCFYQVKTKNDGHWVLSKLLERKKGKNGERLLSTIGKLYLNKINFNSQTKSLNFVSNERYNFDLKSTAGPSLSKTSICASELQDGEALKVKKQLADEHCLSEEPDFEGVTYFISADLSLADHDQHAKGKLSGFLEDAFTSRSFKIGPVHRTVFDEIRRKNNYSEDVTTYTDLVRHKSISRARFEAILQSIGAKTNFDEALKTFETRLHSEGFHIGTLIKIQQAWRTCEIERMDSTNLNVQQIREAAKIAAGQMNSTRTLSDSLTDACDRCMQNTGSAVAYRSREYVMAMILMEYYEQQLPTSDPQS